MLARPDPFSDYRAGFEIRTVQRCASVEIHSDTGTDLLARTLTLSYADQQTRPPGPCERPVPAHLRPGDRPRRDSHRGDAAGHPRLHGLLARRAAVRPGRRRDTPIGVIAGSDHELVDLLGRGLPDVVQLNGVARYWRNTGQGHWAMPQAIPDAPTGVQLGQPGVQFADANGDGHLDLMVSTATTAGYYPWSYTGTWDSTSFRPYPSRAQLRPERPAGAPGRPDRERGHRRHPLWQSPGLLLLRPRHRLEHHALRRAG